MKGIALQNRITSDIIECAIRVHRRFGPGMLEALYETCLTHDLVKMGHTVERQLRVPVEYDGILVNTGFRLDMLVDKLIVVELKAVETVLPVHKSQILTYLKVLKLNLGLLINFNVVRLTDGINRIRRWD